MATNNNNLDTLYSAITVPETGGEADPFIRTKASDASSAYGPAQITYTLAEDYLNRYGDEFSPELQEYGRKFVQQGKDFINKGEGEYGLGGKGVLGKTEQDRMMYQDFAKKLIDIKWKETGGDLDKFIQSWRGVPEKQDPRYYAAIRQEMGQAQMPEVAQEPNQVLPGENPATTDAKLAKNLYGETFPSQPTTKQMAKSVNPSITAYLKNMQTQSVNSNTPKPVYTENMDENHLTTALNPQRQLQSRFSDIGKKTPEERAKIGGQLGGMIGLSLNGVVGSIIGTGIGAMAGRAAGKIQAGEQEQLNRNQKTIDTMRTMGVLSENNNIKFKDGTSFALSTDPNIKLRNTSSVLSGKSERSVYELDKSNPLTTRAKNLVTPIAYYLNHGIMQYSNIESKKDQATVNSTINMLTNAVISDTDNVKTVVARAKELFKKFGVLEKDIKTYLQTVKGKMPHDQYARLEQGVNQIYGS